MTARLARWFGVGRKHSEGGRFLFFLLSSRVGPVTSNYGSWRLGVWHWPEAAITSIVLGPVDINLFHWWRAAK